MQPGIKVYRSINIDENVLGCTEFACKEKRRREKENMNTRQKGQNII